ncbi:MAG TPA: hypothetical protein VE307_05845 [Nitrososphaeraceae archaeon]|nr:hypothetical protein [Nitrososphaeraceae archaeon]
MSNKTSIISIKIHRMKNNILQAFDDSIVEIYKKWGFISVNDFEESGRRKMFIDLAWLENN